MARTHEKQSAHTSEHAPISHELKKHQEKLDEIRNEKAERLQGSHEKAREEASLSVQQEALPSSEYARPSAEQQAPPVIHTKADRNQSFDTTMSHVRQNLSKPEQTFSKLIHSPVVEKTSEIAGKTVARPSGMVGAAIAGAFGVLSVYGIARFAGFGLTGSEMPLFLLLGFLAGLVVEGVYKLCFRRFIKKSEA